MVTPKAQLDSPEPAAPAVPMIHGYMLAAARLAAEEGIAKERKQGSEIKYAYRGIDAVLNTFSTIFATVGLTYRQEFSRMERVQPNTEKGATGKGGVITIIWCELAFFAPDGSFRQVGPFVGEAFDSMDKSASKAQSVALRNALLHTFCVPLGPGYDPEETQEPEYDDRAAEQRLAAKTVEGKSGKWVKREDITGIRLSDGQKKWLTDVLARANKTADQALEVFGGIDAKNAVDVKAWAEGQ